MRKDRRTISQIHGWPVPSQNMSILQVMAVVRAGMHTAPPTSNINWCLYQYHSDSLFTAIPISLLQWSVVMGLENHWHLFLSTQALGQSWKPSTKVTGAVLTKILNYRYLAHFYAHSWA